MDESWENWSSADLLLHLHSLEEENSLQPPQCWEIHKQEDDASSISKQELSHPFLQSSNSYILSFENSTAVPTNIPNRTCRSNHGPQSLMEAQEGQEVNRKPKRGTPSSMQEHIMAERKRRQILSRMFITLSALIPGLKKMDKASILNDAIKYVKNLQKRVKELEEHNQRRKMEYRVFLNNNESDVIAAEDISCISDEFYRPIKTFPKIEARVSGKDVLIRVMCEKQMDIVPKLLAKLEANNLSIVCSSALPFGNSTLDITIITQMNQEFSIMTPDDLVKVLNEELLECCSNVQNNNDLSVV